MFRLRIDNEDVELTDKSKLQLSRLILDLSDFSKRGINISNVLTLPFTVKNDRLTGFPSRLNSNNDAFESNASYTLTQQNNIISTGNVVIKSFDEKGGIKIQLAEGYDFWTLIGKRRMFDLDLFEFDAVFSVATFDILKFKTSSPWLWALTSDSDALNGTALNHLRFTRPCYRNLLILEKIIEQAEFEVDLTNLLTVTDIDNIGMMSNTRNFAVSDYKRFFENVSVPAGDIIQTTGVLEFSEVGNVLLSGNNLINQLYATSYVVKGNVNATEQTTLSITYIGAETTVETVNIPKGRSFLNYRSDEVEIGASTVISVADNVIFEDVRIYSHILETDIAEVEGDWQAPAQQSINNDFLMLMDYNLPSMTQAAFFKTLIKQFFLKVDINPLTKVVQIRSFSDILSTNNAIDLTGKSLRFPPFKSGKSFGQLNTLSYNNQDEISQELGRATFNIENENAIPAKPFLLIPEFSASRETVISGNTTIRIDIYIEAEGAGEGTRITRKDRIVVFKTGVGIPFTAIFSDASWQNLYAQHYLSFIESVRRERMLSVKILLSFLDFKRINDSPIVFIGELNSYFLVLNISGFEEGEFSNVTMVKFT